MRGRSFFVDLERKRRRKSNRRSNKRSIKKRVARKSRRNGSKKKKKKLKGGANVGVSYNHVVIDGSILQRADFHPTQIDSNVILLKNIPDNAEQYMQLYKESDQNGGFFLKIKGNHD